MRTYKFSIFLLFFLTLYIGGCSTTLNPFLEKKPPGPAKINPKEHSVSEKSMLPGSKTLAEDFINISHAIGNKKTGEIIIFIHSLSLIRYTISSLLDPLRLVLDFPGMKKDETPDLLFVGQGVVDKVRKSYLRNGNVLRVQIFLNQDARYHVKELL